MRVLKTRLYISIIPFICEWLDICNRCYKRLDNGSCKAGPKKCHDYYDTLHVMPLKVFWIKPKPKPKPKFNLK